jgi:two-component system, LytTR family, sensor kinase
MESLNTASLINLLGFTVGVALYALLLVMVIRHRKRKEQRFSFDFLLLTTAVLGLLWNIGELSVFVLSDFGGGRVSPILLAISYSALGFLPSVVVHSAWKNSENENTNIRPLTFSAYALSIFAGFLHLQSAIYYSSAPSSIALQILTFGSLALLVGLLVLAFRQTLDKKAVWITALLVFTVSALHLSAQTEEDSWVVELIAHQSSLPLALAILLQDFRFAFADLFLKRALSLILLATVAFGLYVFVAVPLLAWHETHARNDVQAAVLVLSLWMATALIYRQLHRFAVWFVDKIILRRANYETLQIEIARAIEKRNDTKTVLDEVCEKLAAALTANGKNWNEIERSETETNLPAVNFTSRSAEIFVPSTEAPFYEICLNDFTGGRNLLSDEIQMLEAVGLLAARRIDNLRAADARFEQEMQAQEFSKLATEAQLRALRAQINPHFLFNALTTIGYLINTAPDKAFETLMKLTRLLRGILRATGEFSTLGEEIKLIESYLEIEQARFEERLQVKVDVPPALFHLKIPSLILQPLVENAVKHGISNSKRGGEVRIAARLNADCLILEVADTGAGFDEANLLHGIGLSNIENRLQSYFGTRARLSLEKQTAGAIARVSFPVEGKNLSAANKNAVSGSAKKANI